MRSALLVAALLTTTSFAASLASAEISLSIAGARSEAQAVRFDLLVLNDDATRGDQHVVPARLPVRVTTAYNAFDAVAVREDETAADETVEVRAGGFARVAYVVTEQTTGEVSVTLRDAPATTPTTRTSSRPSNPIDLIVKPDPEYRSELGLVEHLANRIKPHEPIYIIAGDEDPTTKFQFSFKYQILNPEGPIARKVPALAGVYFAYSQTSLWDLGDASNPFFDSVYRPEMLVSYENLERFIADPRDGSPLLPEWIELAAQAGYRHESNGRDGEDSRSLNYAYVRPIVTFRGARTWFLTLAPTFYTYVGDLSDNPDIRDYRGHVELRAVVGQGGGVQLAAIGRLGDNGDQKGSIELDLSVPIRKISAGNFDVYFHTQYFAGYGETLLTYDEPTHALRFGVSLVR